jgi:hypothetical protein
MVLPDDERELANGDAPTLETGTVVALIGVLVVSVDDWLDTLVTITELVEVSTTGDTEAALFVMTAVTMRDWTCS